MNRPTNLKAGDLFRVIEGNGYLSVGEIITLESDDGTVFPFFWNADKSDYYCIPFSKLEPYPKTVRDAQVGDVVVEKNSGYEHLVLERGQSTVLVSSANNFKKSLGNYHFDELEKNYTLKAEPVVDDKTAEAMEILKSKGYKISRE